MSPLVEVAGRLVTKHEFDLLEELAREPVELGDTAMSLGVNVGPDGWTCLRKLTGLELVGLVERYDHPSGELAWRLTAAGREPFAG